jgi:hypothetical protein
VRPAHPETVPFPLEVATLPLEADGPGALECLACQVPLELQQPDLEQPLYLLGSCARCGSWYFIAIAAEQGEVVMARMVIPDLIRRSLSAS